MYFGFIGPKMPPPHPPPSISDQHSIVFTEEYAVEKFIEEHLSSQTGLLLAPCAWCETTNIPLKTVSLLSRTCSGDTQIHMHTFHRNYFPPARTVARRHSWLIR